MGYIKTKQLASMVSVEYWRITQINTNFPRLDANVTVEGYADKAARQTPGSVSLCAFSFDLGAEFHRTETNDLLTGDAMLETAYTVLKAQAAQDGSAPDLAWFADAVDD